jgi:MFS family permease
LIMAAFSLGLSAKIVMRFGIRLPIAVGLLLAAVGLGLFSLAPVNGNFSTHILPGMLLLGIGAGMALNPVLLAAMSGVEPGDSGLASGMVNTSFMLGGALGLVVLASIAAARTHAMPVSVSNTITALNSGYHWAFFVGAMFALSVGLLGGIFLRIPEQIPADH